MIFSSTLFLFFFITVFLVQWYLFPALIPEKYRLRVLHLFLLFASYFFYMSWEWQFGFLIAFSTCVDYFAGLYMLRLDGEKETGKSRIGSRRKIALIVSLLTNLGILGYFKYYNFFISSFVDLINTFAPSFYGEGEKYSLLLNVILPLGISFFTFQSMSYTIDVYRRVINAEKSFVKFSLYVSFFPQLVAGPIVVARDFLPQLESMPVFDMGRMRLAARWFALGYFKKTILADNMAPIVDAIYANPQNYDALGHWLGAFGFWVQVYGDFSGYSDMAWGTALFLGFSLPENFRLPYLSRSPAEHWRRWHISLIRWIRDYIYIPMGGNRVNFFRHKINVFATMFLAGLWHGANWTFIIWGSLHGLILTLQTIVVELLQRRRTIAGNKPEQPSVFARSVQLLKALSFLLGTSFLTVYLGTMFRSRNISDSWLILQRMIGLDVISAPMLRPWMYRPVLWGIACVVVGHILGYYFFEKRKVLKIPASLELLALPVIILLFIQLGASGVTPFIYFVF